MGNIEKHVVPWLKDAKFYTLADVDVAWAHPERARMFVNECPFPPSEKVVEAVTKAARIANRYSGSCKDLKAKIGKIYNLGAENVCLGNGSSEFIDAVMRVFVEPGQEVIFPNPAFSMYAVRISVAGGKPVEVPLTADMDIDVDTMISKITDKTKLIMICSPHNPSGKFMPEEDILKVFKTGLPVFMDEAYMEFTEGHQSMAKYIKEYPNVMCFHTLSKAYGLAGIRFGYMLADPKIVNIFNHVVLTWNNSQMNLAAAEAALDDVESLKKRTKHNNDTVKFVVDEMSKIKGVKPYMSHGNYILVDASDTGHTADEICSYVMENKYHIKPMKPHLGKKGIFRITPGTKAENDGLVETLKTFFSKS